MKLNEIGFHPTPQHKINQLVKPIRFIAVVCTCTHPTLDVLWRKQRQKDTGLITMLHVMLRSTDQSIGFRKHIVVFYQSKYRIRQTKLQAKNTDWTA